MLTTVTTGGTSYTVRVTVRAADAAAVLGFGAIATGPGSATAANVLTAKKLSTDATFRLSFDTTNPGGGVGSDPVNVTIFAAETTDNLTIRDLVADLNAALSRAGRSDRVFATLDGIGHVVFKAIDPDTARRHRTPG